MSTVIIRLYWRKFRSQTSDNMDRWKAEQGRGREKRKIRRKKSKKKEDADARKGRKVAKHCVFPMIWGSGGSKSRLAKAAGAEPAGQMRDEKLHAVVARSTFPSQNVQSTPFSDHFWQLRCRKSARRCGAKHISKWKCTKHTILGSLLEVEMSKKCTPLWREAHFQVKMYKTHHLRTTFGSWDVQKVHAVVARSTFPSQNIKNTRGSDHFWKLRCPKSARRCGAKHISKSNCTKHTILGPLLEVEMSKKCTPLWREAHLEVKMYKAHHSRTTFGSSDLEKVHAAVARSTFPSQNVQSTPGLDHFWRFSCRKSARRCGAKHISKWKCTRHYCRGSDHFGRFRFRLRFTTLHYTTLHSTTLHYTTLHYLPLHFTTLHHTTLQYTTTTTTLHYNTLHYTKLHYTTLHYTTLHSTTLHYITLHYTTFRYTSLYYTTLHSTTLQLQLRIHNYTPLLSTTLNYTTPHYITLHYTTFHTLHYTTLHYTTLHYTEWHCTTDRQLDR